MVMLNKLGTQTATSLFLKKSPDEEATDSLSNGWLLLVKVLLLASQTSTFASFNRKEFEFEFTKEVETITSTCSRLVSNLVLSSTRHPLS